jgi:hypothetical protein
MSILFNWDKYIITHPTLMPTEVHIAVLIFTNVTVQEHEMGTGLVNEIPVQLVTYYAFDEASQDEVSKLFKAFHSENMDKTKTLVAFTSSGRRMTINYLNDMPTVDLTE